MDRIRVIHNTAGRTLTVWLGDPLDEHVCEETMEEVVLMKNAAGEVIGIELLHYGPAAADPSLAVEVIVR
ncbi:MAG: DUF2283 domain-containing protein [Gemmatimonadetes bacterium]|nr:DUF2283 domain-containing protein [Gemmatimonadota bacterium]